MPEPEILLATRVSRRSYVVPGSLKLKCSQCGQLVWLAPSSLLILHDNPGMKVLCTECPMPATPDKIQAPTPAQLSEIEEYLETRNLDEAL